MKKYIVVCVSAYEHKIEDVKIFKKHGLAFMHMSKIYYDLLNVWAFTYHEDTDLIDRGINEAGAWLENEKNTVRYDWYIQEVEDEVEDEEE